MDGHIGTNVKREGVGDAGQEICRSHRKRHARVRPALGTYKSLFVWSCSDHQAVFQMVTFHPGRCFMLPPTSDSTWHGRNSRRAPSERDSHGDLETFNPCQLLGCHGCTCGRLRSFKTLQCDQDPLCHRGVPRLDH